MSPLSSERLLAIWEHGVIRHPLDRALLLYAQVRPDLAPDQLADRPLGDRNAALMRLRWRNFGPRLALWLDCPSCGERMEFELTAEQLPTMLAPPESVEVDGQLYRCPTSRDLAQLVGCTDVDTATRQLAQACGASPERCAQIESAIEAADPWADLALEFCCPACAYVGEASLDIAAYLWEEIDCKARSLLDDIHLLAQAYGWNEAEILALSDSRRSAYLARVMA
ncbi:hypothetical protein [Pseudomonas sp. BMS12]|uniref:hypothetical protein n=1 Tax=Pseudomonas sp. BMS12 TaxID=1796033 RepID=UPI00083A44CD|nr:hypothetical protein [Pseudomonas sp. BMS12]